MLRATTCAAACCLAFAVAPLGAQQAAGGKTPSIEERAASMQKLDGYFPLYWDERSGNLYLEIPRFDTEFLYTTGLAAGLGSNDLGLDRGQEGGGRLVSFQRVGPKVLLVQHNDSFRSSSGNPASHDRGAVVAKTPPRRSTARPARPPTQPSTTRCCRGAS